MADTVEKVDIKKAITSPFTGLYWIKVIMYGLGIGALVFIGYSVYNVFRPKPTQSIAVQAGGVVHIDNQGKKRFAMFVEPYVDQSSNRKFGTGVRGGIRWEW